MVYIAPFTEFLLSESYWTMGFMDSSPSILLKIVKIFLTVMTVEF